MNGPSQGWLQPSGDFEPALRRNPGMVLCGRIIGLFDLNPQSMEGELSKSSKTLKGEGKVDADQRAKSETDAKVSTYSGGCHCGKVRYEVATDLALVMACNCSICTKRGTLWNFVPASQFALKKGENDLTDYQFNKHVIHHLFCSTCGILSFARGKGKDGSDTIALNVRCLDEVDLDTLEITKFDGRSL
jgi:hypothetical protein